MIRLDHKREVGDKRCDEYIYINKFDRNDHVTFVVDKLHFIMTLIKLGGNKCNGVIRCATHIRGWQ